MERDLDGIFERVSYQDNESVLLHINTEYEDYDTHWHTAAEIIMPLEGTYQVTINNQAFSLTERDILFIPPGELHSLQAPPAGTRLILMFNFSLINSMWNFSSVIPVLSQPLLISAAYKEIQDNAVELLNQIIDTYPDRSEPLRIAMIYSYLIQFFVLLGRQHLRKEVFFHDSRSTRQMESFDKLNMALNYINTNYVENISIEDAANIAGFSKFHFSRLFKQFTGQSFCNYLNQRRVKAAESLLLNPRMSITDVALQSGFSSLSTFNRAFRSVKECTPSEYKAYYQHRGMRKKRPAPMELLPSGEDLFSHQDNPEEAV